MIVETDFLTHWKTQLLISEMNDKAAPLYVISLWAHCQMRRTDSLTGLHPNAIKAICRYEGEASKLLSALVRAGFLEQDGDSYLVHGWKERNIKLVAQWENGRKGGRPKPNENPTRTQREPNENPTKNWVNPTITDKSRVDKSRVDTSPIPPRGFEEFWEAYPKKIGKGAAEKIWQRLKPSEELRTKFLEAIKVQSQSDQWKKNGGQFISNPATWLNQRRWEDVLTPHKPTSSECGAFREAIKPTTVHQAKTALDEVNAQIREIAENKRVHWVRDEIQAPGYDWTMKPESKAKFDALRKRRDELKNQIAGVN